METRFFYLFFKFYFMSGFYVGTKGTRRGWISPWYGCIWCVQTRRGLLRSRPLKIGSQLEVLRWNFPTKSDSAQRNGLLTNVEPLHISPQLDSNVCVVTLTHFKCCSRDTPRCVKRGSILSFKNRILNSSSDCCIIFFKLPSFFTFGFCCLWCPWISDKHAAT